MDMERLERVWQRVQGGAEAPVAAPEERSEREELEAFWIDAVEERRACESLMRRNGTCRQTLETMRESMRCREGQIQTEYFLRFGNTPAVPGARRHWRSGVISSLRELYVHLEETAGKYEQAAETHAREQLGVLYSRYAAEARHFAAAVRALVEKTQS